MRKRLSISTAFGVRMRFHFMGCVLTSFRCSLPRQTDSSIALILVSLPTIRRQSRVAWPVPKQVMGHRAKSTPEFGNCGSLGTQQTIHPLRTVVVIGSVGSHQRAF